MLPIFNYLLYLFFLIYLPLSISGANDVTLESLNSIPNDGHFGVTVDFDDSQPASETDILFINLIEGQNQCASGNATIIGGTSGQVVVLVQFTSALPVGATGVYLQGSLYPLSFLTDNTVPPLATSAPYFVTVVAASQALSDCLSGSTLTQGGVSNDLKIAPGTILAAPSCGSYQLPLSVELSNNSAPAYVLVNLLDVTNTVYGSGKCKITPGAQGIVSVPVTVANRIDTNKIVHLDLFLVTQSLDDVDPNAAIAANLSAETGISTSVVDCPGSSPESARDKSLSFFKQNGYYIIGAALIVILIALLILYLHKKARARGTSIIFMIRKSTAVSRKSAAVAGTGSSGEIEGPELDHLSHSKKVKEATMLQEPFGGFDDLTHPDEARPTESDTHSPASPDSPSLDASVPRPPPSLDASVASVPPSYPPPPMPSPPPPPSKSPWEKVQDYEKGVEYYWNTDTGATQWDKPEEF